MKSCYDCYSEDIVVVWEFEEFHWGNVILSAFIPVNKCTDCGGMFTGPEADDIMHEKVREHLKETKQFDMLDRLDRYTNEWRV